MLIRSLYLFCELPIHLFGLLKKLFLFSFFFFFHFMQYLFLKKYNLSKTNMFLFFTELSCYDQLNSSVCSTINNWSMPPFSCFFFSHSWPNFLCHPSQSLLLIYLVHIFNSPFHSFIFTCMYPWSIHYIMLCVLHFRTILWYTSHSVSFPFSFLFSSN